MRQGFADSDRDGIPDHLEGNGLIDTDCDGIANSLDPDSDNDTIEDAIESGMFECQGQFADSDGDETPDFLDEDSDNNSIHDIDESRSDWDHDGLADYQDSDDDNDGIPDDDEIGPDPVDPADTDDDGIPDYIDRDSDNDTIPDRFEGSEDVDQDGLSNARDLDSDDDGYPDLEESGVPSGKRPIDTDGDSRPDFLDLDSDDDGLEDWNELKFGTSRTEPDTDGDDFNDYHEVFCGTHPLIPTSFPSDPDCFGVGCGPVEICGDGLDNNCNRAVDEECPCSDPGDTKPCYIGFPTTRGHGICTDGIQQCTEFYVWGECTGSIGPHRDICGDGVDQDCDGFDDSCCEPFPDCVCFPGSVRYCLETAYFSWGIQFCEPDGSGWGECEETVVPIGCSPGMYDTECCIESGLCCQDEADIDEDLNTVESMGECHDALCLQCNCSPDSTRYCTPDGGFKEWGIQGCIEGDFGWDWGPCTPIAPPEVCEISLYTTVDAGICCLTNELCCQDIWDMDLDGLFYDSIGCEEPECCL